MVSPQWMMVESSGDRQRLKERQRLGGGDRLTALDREVAEIELAVPALLERHRRLGFASGMLGEGDRVGEIFEGVVGLAKKGERVREQHQLSFLCSVCWGAELFGGAGEASGMGSLT
jgi:hypothetical protein